MLDEWFLFMSTNLEVYFHVFWSYVVFPWKFCTNWQVLVFQDALWAACGPHEVNRSPYAHCAHTAPWDTMRPQGGRIASPGNHAAVWWPHGPSVPVHDTWPFGLFSFFFFVFKASSPLWSFSPFLRKPLFESQSSRSLEFPSIFKLWVCWSINFYQGFVDALSPHHQARVWFSFSFSLDFHG